MSGHKTCSVFDQYHVVSDEDLYEAAQKLARIESSSSEVSVQTMIKTITGSQKQREEGQLNA